MRTRGEVACGPKTLELSPTPGKMRIRRLRNAATRAKPEAVPLHAEPAAGADGRREAASTTDAELSSGTYIAAWSVHHAGIRRDRPYWHEPRSVSRTRSSCIDDSKAE